MGKKDEEKKKSALEEEIANRTMWHSKTVEECLKELELNADIRTTGLTETQAAERLEKYGPNKLSQKEEISLLMRIWRLNNNILVYILVFIMTISFVKGVTSDGVEEAVKNFIEFLLIGFVIL